MVVTVSKSEALQRLRENRKRHCRIVEEARAGYIDKATKLLKNKLDELAAGKVGRLHFAITMPEDHTSDYDVAIEMLNLHQGDSIEMETIDVRTLMMDEWDWMKTFLFANGPYSGSALEYAQSKGYKLSPDDF